MDNVQNCDSYINIPPSNPVDLININYFRHDKHYITLMEDYFYS
jgi:hypothetical protein